MHGGNAGGPGSMVARVARGGAGVAAVVLGMRVARAATLRVSALLTLRSLLAPIELPIDSGIVAGIWATAFAAAQGTALAAVIADKLRWRGLLGRWGNSLLSPVDAPFVAMYGTIVLTVAPVVALFESALVVFEVMRWTRTIEVRMHQPTEERFWQSFTLGLSALCYGVMGFVIYRLPVQEISGVLLLVSAVTLVVALVTEAGNILHASLLSLYFTSVLCVGLSEEIDIYRPEITSSLLHSPDSKAAQLVLTCVLMVGTFVRGPKFVRTLLFSAARVAEEPSLNQPLTGFARAVVNALVVIFVTFRFLIFNGDIAPGEYYPMVCRGLQIFAAFSLYCAFLRIEGCDEAGSVPQENHDTRHQSDNAECS